LEPSTETRRAVVVAAAIAAATFLCYLPVLGAGFIGLDDGGYVTGNPFVRAGLTPAGVAWAFTTLDAASYYHPLTWLSHMLDVSLFGMSPGAFHAVNLFLHAANAVLLFLLLRDLTGTTWRGAAVAALFALHPTHVESVAWIAERKDLLCVLFSILSLRAWLGYARAPGPGRYAATAALFAAALLSKPMAVVLPLLFLVLDRWPIGRFDRTSPARLLAEKAPLLAMSAAVSAVTIAGQGKVEGLVLTLGDFTVTQRLAVSAVACAAYLGKIAWPANLAVFYPLETLSPPLPEVVGAVALLAAASAAAWRFRDRFPWLAAGWLWFLVSLLPVINLVKVGEHFIADRFTYLPSVGVFIAAAWGVAAVAERFGTVGRRTAAAAALATLSLLGAATWVQAGYWRDSETLFTRTLRVTKDNYFVENLLASEYARQGRLPEAAAHYEATVRINPLHEQARYALAETLARLGRPEEAQAQLKAALVINPKSAQAHNNLGILFGMQRRYAESEFHFREALRLDPGNDGAAGNLANGYMAQGRFREAVPLLSDLARKHPGDARIAEMLAEATRQAGR
jgi:tetratricopeptide (TPR) repeat protein